MGLKINCFEIKQPIGVFYVGYINYQDLLKLADVNERQYNSKLEKYMGIQRKVDDKRLKEIRTFIQSVDSTFPTSIVLNISSDSILSEYDTKNHSMIVKENENVFYVLDGQHRLYSFVNSNVDSDYQLPVTIIIDADLETQAHIFTKINLNQTRVNKSLTYDLFEYAQANSPYKVAHNIVQTLNFTEGPFFQKIKMLGKSDKNFSNQFISQSALVDRILPYISDDPITDTEMIKKLGFNKFSKQVNTSKKAVLQQEFLNEKFEDIAQIFYNYFEIISNKWDKAWANSSYILSKTTGIEAFLRAFRKYIQEHPFDKKEILKYDYIKKLIDKIDIPEDDLRNEKYQSGGVGQTSLYKDIIKYWEL